MSRDVTHSEELRPEKPGNDVYWFSMDAIKNNHKLRSQLSYLTVSIDRKSHVGLISLKSTSSAGQHFQLEALQKNLLPSSWMWLAGFSSLRLQDCGLHFLAAVSSGHSLLLEASIWCMHTATYLKSFLHSESRTFLCCCSHSAFLFHCIYLTPARECRLLLRDRVARLGPAGWSRVGSHLPQGSDVEKVWSWRLCQDPMNSRNLTVLNCFLGGFDNSLSKWKLFSVF